MLSGVAKRLVQNFRYFRAMRQAESHSSASNDPTGRKILSAIRRAQRGKFTQAEDRAFAAIEERRHALLSDQAPITTMDFGAGEVQSLLSKEQQEIGFECRYTVSQIASASKPEPWAKMLYEIINEFRPSHVLEMGTCVGVSGSYMAEALKLCSGRLTTIEGSKTVHALATETFRSLGYDNVDPVQGRFTETLASTFAKNPYEIVFVDGHHDGDATVAYFNQMLPHLKPGAIVVFDDIDWSHSMENSWQVVSCNDRVAASIDLSYMGIVVLN
jgi:predicted O-methyltransferase YrrM